MNKNKRSKNVSLSVIKKMSYFISGIFLITISLQWFLLPFNIASAGVGAIGFLLSHLYTIEQTIAVFCINVIMLGFCWLLLEKRTFLNTVSGSLLFPVFLGLIPQWEMVSHHGWSLVLGSLLFSLGIFLLYQIDASNGGVTVPPLIFKKYLNLPVAYGIFMTNFLIILLNLKAFGIIQALLSAFSIVLISLSMSFYQKYWETMTGNLKKLF